MNARQAAKRLLIIQILLSLLLAALFWAFMDGQAAYSALIAGAICILANGYFAWRVLRIQGATRAKQFVLAFCFGELMKLLILGVLFVLAVVYLHINIGPFLVSFMLNLLVFWIAPFMRWEN